MNFKRILTTILVIIMLFNIVSCNSPEEPGDETPGDETPGDEAPGDETPGEDSDGSDKLENTEPAETVQPDGTTPCNSYLENKALLAEREVAYVTLRIDGLGDIKLALDATAAPGTVRRFLRLVTEDFYDGLSFYAATENFVIQGGDPDIDKKGVYRDEDGNIRFIEGEFARNGYENNDIKHRRGVISMFSFSQPVDSGSAQFFICSASNKELSSLDGYYAPFGYVIDGMDVVDKINETAKHTDKETQLIPDGKRAIIKEAVVDELGGIDPYEQICIKGDTCEYLSRDVSGRDIVYVEITVKSFGKIKLLLDRTTAPITVDNFVALVNRGFYDGLTFHRVMESFMIQGGDPNADGSGGNTDADGNKLEIKGEFSENGWDNDLLHKRGVISMARGNAPDSASSQFFICSIDSPHLDGKYAAFGYVVDGLHIIDEITMSTVIHSGYNGTISVKENQAVIESIRIA